MITIFSIPKPFKGHIGIIQRNALESWTKLDPECEVILFGDDEGVAEAAKELGVKHVSEVEKNEFGTPLLDFVFEQAQQMARHNKVCYVNADIILLNDFVEAVRQVTLEKFLMVGQRWDVDIERIWDFQCDSWEKQLRSFVENDGQLHPPTGSDYFIFPKGALGKLPPFAVGRPRWDNWVILRARTLGLPVVDASQMVTAIHQNHDYSHVSGGMEGYLSGTEAERNISLVGGRDKGYTLLDANKILTPQGLRRSSWTLSRLRRAIGRFVVSLPMYYRVKRAIKARLYSARDTLVDIGLLKGWIKRPPSLFTIETNVGCNLNCPECPLGSGSIEREKGCMSFDKFKVLADKARPFAEQMIVMNWGEPLLNKDLVKMVSYASEFTSTLTSTNGMLLTPEVAEQLIISGIETIIVSVDGATQEVYERYRVGGNLEKVLDSLKILQRLNVKHGSMVKILPQFVVFKHNQHEMEQFERICRSIGLRPNFKAPYLRDSSFCENPDNPKYIRKTYKNKLELAKAMSRCGAAKKGFTVSLDGSVVVCCYDHNGITNFGNLFRQDVMEIWNSPKYVSFRNDILSGNPPDFCVRNCLMYCLQAEEDESK